MRQECGAVCHVTSEPASEGGGGGGGDEVMHEGGVAGTRRDGTKQDGVQYSCTCNNIHVFYTHTMLSYR